ncbi:Gp15 family bacteriophage protein [Geobacillus stearothermophilus]|uniref:Gp15 family bacteriophage protein n=1 Tax=Geobacillus stearothermophilus TaxID=1422 RepID=UPI002402CB0A|nr:Gp15 family bacteriophage protein [Geobacillus stearothermophilus]MDF9296109.1 Gp15 family bacteriophage protein [Geobacillus stearothermophilus]
MFSLTSTFDDEFEYKGAVIRLNLAFDNVLRVFELLEDDTFYDWEKVDIALEILVDNYEDIEDLPINEKFEMYAYIFKEFLDIDFSKARENGIVKKVFDFKKDAGLIYASFLSAYGMDLFEQQGKLHWQKFIQLLTNLGKDTVFKEVVNIRQMKVPPPDKYNREYREYVLKMKRLYRLEDETEIIDEKQAVKEIDRKWDMVASMFKPKGR